MFLDPFTKGHPANFFIRCKRYFYPEVNRTGAGCVVINPNNEVLLIHRGSFYNDWTFPKGKIKSKNLKNEALREVLEEVSVSPKIICELPSNIYSFYVDESKIRINNTVYFFLAKVMNNKFSISNNFDLKEASTFSEAKWFDLDKAVGMVTHNTEKVILEAAIKILNI